MNKLTLNVGCGKRVFKEYPAGHKCINVDERDLPMVDHVLNVREPLPFPDWSFDYILASDIIEHFPISQTKGVLINWLLKLKPGGIIEFRLPNLAAIVRHYNPEKGWENAKYVSWLLYGGQDYSGNFHYVAFDRSWFKEVCSGAGLNEISYKEDGFNMVVKFRKGE